MNELVLAGEKGANLARTPIDQGIAGWVLSHGIGQIIADVEQDTRTTTSTLPEQEEPVRSLICVPMRAHQRVIGVLKVINKRNNQPFNDADLTLLIGIGLRAGIAIDAARHYQKLHDENTALLQRDAELRQHIIALLRSGPLQGLGAISAHVQFISRMLDITPERLPAELDTLDNLVHKTSRSLRAAIFDMRPAMLATHGLVGALQSLVEYMRAEGEHMAQVRLEAKADFPRLDAETERTLYAILQEALTNAIMHARAPEVVLYLYTEAGQAICRVRDHGTGFHPAASEASFTNADHIGLQRMREQAQQIGADLHIQSDFGKGTVIETRLPLV